MSDRFIVHVEGAVEKDGRYLMIVRAADVAHAPGALSFPGGKVESADGPDDALESTLRREIREEVGVEIEDEVRYVYSRRFDTDDGKQVVGITFLCRYNSGHSVGRAGRGRGCPVDDARSDTRRGPAVVRPERRCGG